MSITQSYMDSVAELLAFVPELKIRKMFGGAGASTGELMFAILDDDELWLKADAESAPVFEAEGLPQFTYPMKSGARQSMAYWQAPAEVWDDEDAARKWVTLAIDTAMRGRAKKKPKKKK